jgi:hypothetical protein
MQLVQGRRTLSTSTAMSPKEKKWISHRDAQNSQKNPARLGGHDADIMSHDLEPGCSFFFFSFAQFKNENAKYYQNTNVKVPKYDPTIKI